MKPNRIDAYRLLHDGALALSRVEANGIRIDVDLLDETIEQLDRRIACLENELKQTEVWKTWRDTYGTRVQLGSRQQLGHVLFNVMKLPCKDHTITGRPKTDEAALNATGLPFVMNFLEVEKLKKTKGTYLEGIRREVVDGFLHPSFNLHLVRTYRSSSSNPNFQNIPIRDQQIGTLVRRCFIPRTGHQLVEIDYSGIEVRIAACYNEDPTLIQYIKDPARDMHRDMAAECFCCRPDQVSKETRFYAKNQFVFPEFYGSYWLQCAENLWAVAQELNVDGVPMQEHLKNQGIRQLGSLDPKVKPRKGSFTHHIQEVEKDFWENRFKVYADWKDDWYARYLKRGYFDMKTGFRCSGLMRRNDVINYPVQGSAFHCLLWSLVRLERYIRKQGMETKLVGQIHDSIVADVPEHEFEQYIEIARWIMTEELPKAWPWIIVPLEVEVEACELGESWNEKRKVQ